MQHRHARFLCSSGSTIIIVLYNLLEVTPIEPFIESPYNEIHNAICLLQSCDVLNRYFSPLLSITIGPDNPPV